MHASVVFKCALICYCSSLMPAVTDTSDEGFTTAITESPALNTGGTG